MNKFLLSTELTNTQYNCCYQHEGLIKVTTDPFYREMENKLRDRFQTKIKISGNAKGGKIELSYHNSE